MMPIQEMRDVCPSELEFTTQSKELKSRFEKLVSVIEKIWNTNEKVTPFLGHLLTVVRDSICLVFLKDSNMAKSYYFLFVLIFFYSTKEVINLFMKIAKKALKR